MKKPADSGLSADIDSKPPNRGTAESFACDVQGLTRVRPCHGCGTGVTYGIKYEPRITAPVQGAVQTRGGGIYRRFTVATAIRRINNVRGKVSHPGRDGIRIWTIDKNSKLRMINTEPTLTDQYRADKSLIQMNVLIHI